MQPKAKILFRDSTGSFDITQRNCRIIFQEAWEGIRSDTAERKHATGNLGENSRHPYHKHDYAPHPRSSDPKISDKQALPDRLHGKTVELTESHQPGRLDILLCTGLLQGVLVKRRKEKKRNDTVGALSTGHYNETRSRSDCFVIFLGRFVEISRK